MLWNKYYDGVKVKKWYDVTYSKRLFDFEGEKDAGPWDEAGKPIRGYCGYPDKSWCGSDQGEHS